MDEKRQNKIALYLEKEMDDCDKCPLEKICDETTCIKMWKRFLNSKIRAKDILEN